MDLLTFHHVGLPAAEASLIATLFRLHGVDRSFIWTLGTQPPFDALLVDSSCDEADFGHLKGKSTQVMRLAPHGQNVDGYMDRPIRSDALLEWLNQIELILLHGTADRFASTLQHTRSPRSSLPPIFGFSPSVAPSARSVQRKQKPQKGATEEAMPKAWEQRSNHTTFKLKRWPPSATLKNDVSKVRVATMVSRKALTLQAVSDLARVSLTVCEACVRDWAQLGLVEFGAAEPAPQSLPATASDRPVRKSEPTTRQGFGAALIQGIRRRFGIL